MTTEPDTQDETQRVPFAAFIQDLRNGIVHAELTRALADLVEAVTTCQKPGELVLKLKVAANGTRQVSIVESIVAKTPEEKRPSSLFFVDDANNLRRDDPLQPRLPLREVPRPDRAEPKEAIQ